MGAKYFSPILKVKIGKNKRRIIYRAWRIIYAVAENGAGRKTAGEFLGPANFTKKHLSI